jgi:iron complex outermembrane receptor protein
MKIKHAALSAAIALAPASVPFIALAQETRTMEEVVVTSRRKDESVQDVPLSVTVFGEEKIEQVKPATLRDFDGLAPNVYIGMNAAGPGNSTIYIRGVGYPGSEKTQSPQVAVIVDDVQMGSSTGALIDVFDIESMEINRGPQGVLFGRNTIGGNIVVNRVKPKFNEFGFDTSVIVGNYNARTVKARVNIPLIDDKLALKVGAISRKQDGFYDNLTIGGEQGDIDFASQTLALRWAPNDSFDAILTYDRIDDETEITPQDTLFDGDSRFKTLADRETPTSYEVDQWALRVNWDINDNLSLVSITADNSGTDKTASDFDGAFIGSANWPIVQLHPQRNQDFDYFSQELRLSGSITDNLDFMVGYSYFDSDLDYIQLTNNMVQLPSFVLGLPPGVPCAVVPGLRANPTLGDSFCQFPNERSTQSAGEKVESTAFFASLTWRPTETLEFLIGARRIDEEKDGRNAYIDHQDGTFDLPSDPTHDFSNRPQTPGNSYTVSDDWQDTIMTASANWLFRPNARVYASYSEGFRSGGFSIRSVNASTAPYLPEEAEQLEIGIKSDWLDGALRFNLAYYELDRDGGQFISIITLPAGEIPGTNTIINNGGASYSEGWELETAWIINENFSLIANAGTIDTDSDVFTLPCDVLDGCVLSGDPLGTIRTVGGTGDSRQPEDSWSLRLAYTGDLGPGVLGVTTGYKYVGDFLLVNTGAGPNNQLFEGDYGQWDAHISYDMNLNNGDRLSFSLYGKNLGDTAFKEQALFLGSATAGFQGWGAPRTYAFEVRYSR